MMKRIIWVISGLNRRMMKLLVALALIAYIASVWGTYTNMRSIQEHGEMKIEERIDEVSSLFLPIFPIMQCMIMNNIMSPITGGAGFVGSHLTDKLMMDGHEVTVVDNFFTGRKRNVEHWIGHENFELINHDVVEPLYIEVSLSNRLLGCSTNSVPFEMCNLVKK
uniref:UDP-glucuronic acid decarboxylase 1 n=1 Tax=Hucho hucho TaxID=62062 RepID=A0A4W5RTI4_9TELE